MPKTKNRDRECLQCSKPFSLDDPNARKKYCCIQCMTKFHWLKNGEKYRNSEKGKQTAFSWRLRTLFNMTVEEYNSMLEKQGYKCKICETKEPMGYGWHIDHCHETNKVRGILCQKCNQGLGLFNDNLKALQKAIEYLENSKN